MGRLLAERYNDIDKVVELLCCGDIVSLHDHFQHTIFGNPLDYERVEDYDVKIANRIGSEYFLKGDGIGTISFFNNHPVNLYSADYYRNRP